MRTDATASSPDLVWVVMRSLNDRDLIEDTLAMVRRQKGPRVKLLNIDSGSTDGTVDVIREYTDRLIQIRPEDYIPGRVLNRGLRETDGPVVVFLNSDATPLHDDWLSKLLAAVSGENVAAAYGRQTSRHDTWPLFHKDNERAFGDGHVAAGWTHFFSMASSAVVRSVWAEQPFDESIPYSEDVEWSYRARQAGYLIRYAPDAVVAHSHNYTLAQSWKRHRGEGAADACIFPDLDARMRLPRVLASAGVEVVRDVTWCVRSGRPMGLAHAIPLRLAQRLGRYQGYWQERRKRREDRHAIHD